MRESINSVEECIGLLEISGGYACVNHQREERKMSISMYSASVPVFTQMLGSLSAVLTKAEAYAEKHKIDADALLGARLFPNMFPLRRQVQIACDFARGVSARLAGVEVPKSPDTEQTFEDLQALITKTVGFVESLSQSQFDQSDSREIVTRPGTPKERRFTGHAYLLNYGLPQFFFHITTAYALLRHNGVELGKGDYMGTY